MIVSERALGFSLGVTDYLVKPVDRKVLIDVLERLRERREGRVALDDTVPTVLFLSVTIPEDELAAVIARVQSARYADQTRTVLVARTDEEQRHRDWLRRAATAVIDDSALDQGETSREALMAQLRSVLAEITARQSAP